MQWLSIHKSLILVLLRRTFRRRVVRMQLCVCMQAIMQAHKHNMQMHIGSHFDQKGFFKFSLPALQVPANNQSMTANSLDPEVAFGTQKEWVSPRLERPWVGPNAVSLIPEGATADQVIQALELWGMPAEAWPKTGKKKVCTACQLHSAQEGLPRHLCVSWKADVYHNASTPKAHLLQLLDVPRV